MLARPAVEKGRHVPDPHTVKELVKDPEAARKAAESTRQWVQQGMADDKQK